MCCISSLILYRHFLPSQNNLELGSRSYLHVWIVEASCVGQNTREMWLIVVRACPHIILTSFHSLWAAFQSSVFFHLQILQTNIMDTTIGKDVAKIMLCLSFLYFFFLESFKDKGGNVTTLSGSLHLTGVPWFHLGIRMWDFCTCNSHLFAIEFDFDLF